MEYDNEIQGGKNSYTTEFRQYDPRLGRWKSLDPLMAQFPSLSPYVGFDNNPIYYNDPYGLASEVVTDGAGEPDKTITKNGKDAHKGDLNNRTETLLNMKKVAHGTIVRFEYPDDEHNAQHDYEYDAEKGVWNETYTYGTSTNEDYNIPVENNYVLIGSPENEGGNVPMIAKAEPPVPTIKEATNQAGSTIDTDSKDPIKPKKPKVRINPPRAPINPPRPPIVPPRPPIIPPPPCFQSNSRPVNINAPFNPNSWTLINPTNTGNWLNGLARTLINNPNATLTIFYNINVPNLPVNQAWNANNTIAGVPNRVMGLNRALVIQTMLINLGVPGNQLNTARGNTNNAMSATGTLTNRVRTPCP